MQRNLETTEQKLKGAKNGLTIHELEVRSETLSDKSLQEFVPIGICRAAHMRSGVKGQDQKGKENV